ncbi:hypothetical protein JXB12_09330 [candidate division KSB1 bacterium]|nr:hypothetical protein [candidate division KSB1 bacterium]
MFDCVGIGLNAVDFICLLSKYPEIDSKTESTDFSTQGGGPVPTALVTLARLGAKTSYIGIVGQDENGKFLLDQFKKEGVDVSGVIIDKNCPTNQAFIWVDKESGKKTVVLHNSTSNVPLLPDEISETHLRKTRFLHLDGRDAEATLKAIRLAKRNGADIVLDAGSVRSNTEELLMQVDYPIVSEHFCQTYLETTEAEKGLEKLYTYGVKAAIITCGVKGSYGIDDTGVYYQPAYEVEVLDTTGAGDVYHGAFIYGLIKKWDLPRMMKFSAAAAALKCKKLGGRSGIPRLDEINLFLEEKENVK